MRRLLLVVLGFLLLEGCVLREFTIESEPSGAEVYLDGVRIGKTPLKRSFEHYGTHRVVLRMPKGTGYLACVGKVRLKVPWWQIFPLDFITEVLLPFKITDRQTFFFRLEKVGQIPDELKKKAEEMRKSGE